MLPLLFYVMHRHHTRCIFVIWCSFPPCGQSRSKLFLPRGKVCARCGGSGGGPVWRHIRRHRQWPSPRRQRQRSGSCFPFCIAPFGVFGFGMPAFHSSQPGDSFSIQFRGYTSFSAGKFVVKSVQTFGKDVFSRRAFTSLLRADLRQYRIILSADTASEVRQMLSQKRR